MVAPESIIVGSGLTKSFGGLTAVAAVDIELRPGEILGLIGPNGAGKTTLFNMLTGFARPTAGVIYWEGEDVTELMPHEIAARGLGRTFQHAEVFPGLTVLENVVVGCHRYVLPNRRRQLAALLRTPGYRRDDARARERAASALEEVGCLTARDANAGKLSHGEARLLGIAIALACRPKALLLDEPAAGLNPTESRDLMRRLGEIAARGVALLIVEHDMRLIMGLCHRLVVLDHGAKIFDGSPEEAQRAPVVVTAYLGEEVVAP